jgi:hypothetical protein
MASAEADRAAESRKRAAASPDADEAVTLMEIRPPPKRPARVQNMRFEAVAQYEDPTAPASTAAEAQSIYYTGAGRRAMMQGTMVVPTDTTLRALSPNRRLARCDEFRGEGLTVRMTCIVRIYNDASCSSCILERWCQQPRHRGSFERATRMPAETLVSPGRPSYAIMTNYGETQMKKEVYRTFWNHLCRLFTIFQPGQHTRIARFFQAFDSQGLPSAELLGSTNAS